MKFTIEAEPRTSLHKSQAAKLRKQGYIPAVVYGPGIEPVHIAVSSSKFIPLYKKSIGELAFYELQIQGKTYHTLIKERQIHPVSREIIHLDFMLVPAHQIMDVEVPIKFVGTPEGVKAGGILDIVHRTVKIHCFEEDIPEDIEADISHLKVGDAFHVRQLPVGKWTVKDNPDNTLVVIHAKRVEPKTTESTKVEEKQESKPE